MTEYWYEHYIGGNRYLEARNSFSEGSGRGFLGIIGKKLVGKCFFLGQQSTGEWAGESRRPFFARRKGTLNCKSWFPGRGGLSLFIRQTIHEIPPNPRKPEPNAICRYLCPPSLPPQGTVKQRKKVFGPRRWTPRRSSTAPSLLFQHLLGQPFRENTRVICLHFFFLSLRSSGISPLVSGKSPSTLCEHPICIPPLDIFLSRPMQNPPPRSCFPPVSAQLPFGDQKRLSFGILLHAALKTGRRYSWSLVWVTLGIAPVLCFSSFPLTFVAEVLTSISCWLLAETPVVKSEDPWNLLQGSAESRCETPRRNTMWKPPETHYGDSLKHVAWSLQLFIFLKAVPLTTNCSVTCL